MTPSAYLALGANLGNRRENLRMALRGLTRMARVLSVSGLYESAPEAPGGGSGAGPPYYNAVCAVATGLESLPLLRFLKALEREIGRRPAGAAAAPRPIDLDILLYGDVVLDTPELTLPHPRLAGRAFVLVPLAEIAPGLVLPTGERVQALAAPLRDRVTQVEPIGWGGVTATEQEVRL